LARRALGASRLLNTVTVSVGLVVIKKEERKR